MLATRNGIGSLRDEHRIYEGSILNFKIQEKCLDNMRMGIIFHRGNSLVYCGFYYREQFAARRMCFDLEYPSFLDGISEDDLQKGR